MTEQSLKLSLGVATVLLGGIVACLGAYAVNALPAVYELAQFTGAHIAATVLMFTGMGGIATGSYLVR